MFPRGLLESGMHSAVLAELHKVPAGPPTPACLGPSGRQPQHRAYGLVPPSRFGVTGNLEK